MMSKKRRWIWITLFVCMAVLIGTLATGWNVVLVRDYLRLLKLAQNSSISEDLHAPWASLILGTLGFVAVLGMMILFFVRLLGEMRLNQLQSEFIATVSHELKTPIAAIDLSSSLLRAGVSPEESIRLWESHGRELKRLREEVETLLEAARWQSKSFAVKETPINLEAWLTDSMNRWTELLGPSALLIREGESLSFPVSLEVRTLNLIVDNLLDNARKFARERPEVVIRTRLIHPNSPKKHGKKPTGWQIEIEDHGWGFDPAHSKKIFGRFIRARSLAPYAIPGTGLGLYLAQTASKALRLKLTAESQGNGQGAKFTLEGGRIL